MNDPAVLFYIGDWLKATKGMKAHEKGWYLNLVLYNYEYGSLPNDLEELANLCDVRISEYDLFKQVFEHVLKQKFEQTSEGRLTNPRTTEILRKRKEFKNKRSNAGKMSYVVRYVSKHHQCTQEFLTFFKNNIDLDKIDTKNEHMLEQVFEHLFELYKNGNRNENRNKEEDKEEEGISIAQQPVQSINYQLIVDQYHEYCPKLSKVQTLNDSRKKAIKARVKEHGFDKIVKMLQLAGESNFLNGHNDRDWTASFDWLFNATNFVKVLDGNYSKSYKNGTNSCNSAKGKGTVSVHTTSDHNDQEQL